MLGMKNRVTNICSQVCGDIRDVMALGWLIAFGTAA